MKKLLLIILFIYSSSFCFSQNLKSIDSLKYELSIAKHDISRAKLTNNLCERYIYLNLDSSLYYGQKALGLARKNEYTEVEVDALVLLASVQRLLGNYPKALELALKSIQITEKDPEILKHSTSNVQDKYWLVGIIYRETKNYRKSLIYFQKYKSEAESFNQNRKIYIADLSIGSTYLEMNQLDSALFYCQKAYDKSILYADENPFPFNRALGKIYDMKGDNDLALKYFYQSQPYALLRNYEERSDLYYRIAMVYKKTNKIDSSIYYAQKAFNEAQKDKFYKNIIDASGLLSQIYEKTNPTKSLEYNKLANAAKDSLYEFGKTNAIDNLMKFDEEERKYEIEIAKNQIKQYALLVGLGMLLLIAFLLYRNNLKEKKAKELLQLKNEEIQSTLSTLKATQAQLIQSEKLASLGELTAGIAHEIQNPLNFVNNFSELSVELANELSEALRQRGIESNSDEGELVSDLIQNQEKIHHHGKRASSIVKGMLEHSRTSSGEKELTDINALADEYLRLAYHGLRAKDSNGPTGTPERPRFNSDFKTEFDESLPKIKVIPQDIGRVLLNLINNAFYACAERSRSTVKSVDKPLVVVSTKKTENQVIISVKDNGIGISDEVKAKIFQPFFTTKPTGQGTGLGLSLAYDIVTKGHGGTIEVQSKEGVGTKFIISLNL